MRLAKSDGRIAAPDTCLTEAWKRLTTERKVEHVGWWKTRRGTVSRTLGHRVCYLCVVVGLDDVRTEVFGGGCDRKCLDLTRKPGDL